MAHNNVEDTYPLSPLQEGMLFHTLHATELQVYCEQMSAVLQGNLDADGFNRAWQQVVNRHPILRTAFAWKNLERPIQVVGRRVGVVLAREDWRDLSVAERETRLAAHLEAERRRGFQLSRAPLMRLGLFRIAEDAHYLVWSFHHLLLDGWSVGLVLKEVLACYEASVAMRDAHLERPRPYRDYIGWLQRQDLAQAERYWREALRGFGAPTPLPMKRQAPLQLEEARRFSEERVDLPPEATAALRALARKQRLTLNTLVQGAWALLLSRYSGEREIVFGATVSGRPAGLVGVEAMVGLFINTLPVRVQVRGDAALLPWLRQLQEQQVEREQYAYSPLVEIQGWSEVPRGTPLFESLVVFENFPVDRALTERQDGVYLREVRSIERSKYPVSVVAAASDDEMQLKLFYDAACFERAAIARLLGHLQAVLVGMAANPDLRLGEVPTLNEAERQRVVCDWNAIATPRPTEESLHRLVEAQVARTPDAVAVSFAGESLTYRALDARADRIAQRLRDLGVGPDGRVGLLLERSLDLIVGVLAVLKAGGAYVPLDPSYPVARLAFMVNDAGPEVILTHTHLRQTLPEHPHVVCLDEAGPSIVAADPARSFPRPSPGNLAYVIYTSGSTGTPKGVAVTHESVVNHCLAQAACFALDARDRVLQFASISFDAAVEEIFPTLARGATLVLRPAGAPPTIDELLRLVRDDDITVLNLPTAYWHEWAQASALETMPIMPRLRLVVVGGEKASAKCYARWRKLVSPNVVWINTYGPTETTVVSTTHRRVGRNARADGADIPIGSPLANLRAYVLDAGGMPLPVGVPGELYIGGAGLARGYLRQPGLTAERFVPHPFVAGERVYRTGDVARWNDDGELEYVGRVDHQLKLRGHRIEPGEIATTLAAHEDVSQAVVVPREDAAGETRLVAYVVATYGATPTCAELRAYLQERLPAYMVPAIVTLLEALPLTPGGKVDRRALPAPDAPAVVVKTELAHDGLEHELVRIWCDVLAVPRVGVQDNFFELGGHSIKAIRLVQKIERELGRALPLQVLFARPTVRGIGRWMNEYVPDAGSYRIPLRTVKGAEHMVAFLPTILGTGVHHGPLARALTQQTTMATCRLPGAPPAEAASTSIEALAAHCKAALVVPGEHREWSLVGWSFGGVVAYETARLMRAEGLRIRRLVLIDAFLPAAAAWEVNDALRDETIEKELQAVLSRHGGRAHDGSPTSRDRAREPSPDVAVVRRTVRANVAALHAYRPQACRLPIREIRAAETQRALRDGTLAARPIASWSEERTTVVVPGDHDSLFSPTHLPGLALALSAALEEMT